MKTPSIKLSIHKLSRGGGVKAFLFLLASLLILSFYSCGNISDSNKKPKDNPAVPQQPVDDDTSDDEAKTQDPPQTNDDDDDDTNNDDNNDDDEDDDNQPKILTITLGDEYDISTLNNYEKVILAVPQEATSIDALALAFIHMEINDEYRWQEPDFELEFADYPETAQDFVIDFDSIINSYNKKYENLIQQNYKTQLTKNTDVLKLLYSSFNYYKLTEQNVGQTVETEIMPGLNIITYMELWYDEPVNIQNALKVSRATTVKMPSEYSLTETYKCGIIGNNVTLENLNVNTKISGTVTRSESYSSVYDLFVKDKSVNNLPEMDIEFEENANLYGYNIDLLIKKYYDNDAESRLSLDLPNGVEFNARAYLNGSKMYSGNDYQQNKAYKLDINAALVMGAEDISFRNVELTGTKKATLNRLAGLTNVRASVSMSGISVSNVSGVVEFMNDAPSRISGRNSYTVFTKVENDMVVGGLGYVDATALDQTAADHFKSASSYYSLEQFAKKTLQISFIGSAPTYDAVTNANNLRMTKEQVEQIGVTGGGLS